MRHPKSFRRFEDLPPAFIQSAGFDRVRHPPAEFPEFQVTLPRTMACHTSAPVQRKFATVLTRIEGVMRSQRSYNSAVVRPMMKALGGLESGQMRANAIDVVTSAGG